MSQVAVAQQGAAVTAGPCREYKTVKSGGLTFTVMSSRERETSLGGRHFFCVGRNCTGWTLFEHDQRISEHGSCRSIGRKFERLADTKTLVAEIQRLVETGDKLPTDCRPPWMIDRERFESDRYLACQVGDVKVYHTLRFCGRVIREYWFTTDLSSINGESNNSCANQFDARDLPEQYRVGDKPIDWIKAALAEDFDLLSIEQDQAFPPDEPLPF